MNLEVKEFESLNYIVRYPKGYIEGEKYPVVIYLHGAGSRGDNIEPSKNSVFMNSTGEYPFVSISPQCNAETWFDVFEQLKRLVMSVVCSDFADEERIYLTGASMGGYGTWQLAISMPEVFAAIVPICGGGMYWDAGRLKNVPVWAFHGGKDPVVLPEESKKMVDAVNRREGNAKLTVYPENGHDAWTDTYSNPEVFEWLLSQRNVNANDLENMFDNDKIYG